MYMRNRITLNKINHLLLVIMLLLGSLGTPIPGAARAIAEPGAQSGASPTPPAAPSAPGDESWLPGFHLNGMDAAVHALAVDAQGDLYAAGDFTTAGDAFASFVARWDGAAWHAIGGGMNGAVHALAFDSAGNLYAGGEFTLAGGGLANRIAVWDGTEWLGVGSGMNNTVYALAIDSFDILYAGGDFTQAGGGSAGRIARWDGNAWSALSTPGAGNTVYALAVDSNDLLYAGGAFTTIGISLANRVAVWDGDFWSALGAGADNTVRALVVNSSDNLYAGGDFTSPASHIARWDGAAWSGLNSGVDGAVHSLMIDSLNTLYVGGDFANASGLPASRLAAWNGDWAALGDGVDGRVRALAANSSGHVFAGGDFANAGALSANRIAGWDGLAWYSLGEGNGVNDVIHALAVDGSLVYVAGEFSGAGGVAVTRIARWDGAAWTPLGAGLNDTVLALAMSGDGSLYAGGEFTQAGGNPANYVAKWDGAAWSALGSGVNFTVESLAVGADGNLYAGGQFTQAGGSPAQHVAKWDGADWSDLGPLAGDGVNGTVHALAVDGSGDLYAGGLFTLAGGNPASFVAKWDGAAWSALGSGANNIVESLAVDESGMLYAAGQFTSPGERIAMWDGAAWSALGSGMDLAVESLAADGAVLYAGGQFTQANGQSAAHIAKWENGAWTALGSGLNATAYSLAADASGNLYAGGSFTVAGGKLSYHIAHWQPPDAGVTKSVNLSQAAPGDEVIYVLNFNNGGPGLASSLTLTDTIPSGLEVTSVVSSGATIIDTGYSPGYVWLIADLLPGASGTITITSLISQALTSGWITNTVSIAADGIERRLNNNQDQVTFVVDSDPPQTTITSAPASPTTTVDAVFEFIGQDGNGSGVASFECQFDNGAYLPCSSPIHYSSLSDGLHTFRVQAIDLVGLIDPTPAEHSWIVDTVPPDTIIIDAPADPDNSPDVLFWFNGEDGNGSGAAAFYCQMDGGSYESCASPMGYYGLSDGEHAFNVYATDAVSLTDATPAGHTWLIDTVPPQVTITQGPPDPNGSTNAVFYFEAEDGAPGTSSGLNRTECKLDDNAYDTCTSPMQYSGLSGGTHTFWLRAYDNAGNYTPTAASYTWTANRTPIVYAGADQAIDEGQVITFTGEYIDPLRSVYLPSAATIQWELGDGAQISGTLTPQHAYADNGVYTATLTVTDEFNASGQDKLLVSVANVAPSLAPLSDQQVDPAQPLTVTIAFTDPGLLDTHSLQITWQAGISQTFELTAGVSSLVTSYTYVQAGRYTVSVVITDKDGGQDTRTFAVQVGSGGSIYLPLVKKQQ